jgi:hypothetical protein
LRLNGLLLDRHPEPERFPFDLHQADSSIDQWLRQREERRSTSVLNPEIVARSVELLATSRRQVCVTKAITQLT